MKKYKCEVHGHIDEETLQMSFDDKVHIYCLRCLDEALLKSFKTVELVEDDDDRTRDE